MVSIQKIKEDIYKYYPPSMLSVENSYLQSDEYKRYCKLIESSHLNRDRLNVLVKQLRITYSQYQIEDLLMGRDFPCYLVQIIIERSNTKIRVLNIYISFISNVHSCYTLEMSFPNWEIEQSDTIEKETLTSINDLVIKHFKTIEIEHEILNTILDDIWLKDGFSIFNALFMSNHKIV